MSPRVVYFDLASGAGGDMLIAALAHAGGADGTDVEGPVVAAVRGLDLRCDIAFAEVTEGGMAALHAAVETDDSTFTSAQMTDAIARTKASDRAKSRAAKVIELLVGAEARVHGMDPAHVHLHELGSADTVADAIGAAVALETLGVDLVTAAAVPMSSGWIVTDHGPLPLPAPATLEVLRGTQVAGVDASGELVTPTAAAILVAHECAFGVLPNMTLDHVGVGAGSRRREVPNICRALIGTRAPAVDDIATELVVVLETNIDDQTPEGLGYAVERLLGAGALDAWVTPIVMKKSRPAFQLSVLANAVDEPRILDVIFRETTTLGLRRRETQRWVLARDEIVVEIAGQCVRVKVALLHGDVVGANPEFDDCVRASKQSGWPLKDTYAAAVGAARAALRVLD